MSTQQQQKQDPVVAEIVSNRAAQIFESRYASLLVCWDVGKVFTSIANFFRLEGVPQGDSFTVPNLVAATEKAFMTLLERGALDQYQKLPSPLPEAAQAELDAMQAAATGQPLPVAEPEADDQAEAITKCAADFRNLDATSFKTKWMSHPRLRSIYDIAVAAGRI